VAATVSADLNDWQARVVAERDELFKKYTKLDEFLHTKASDSVGAEQRALLNEQRAAMGVYLGVLNRRIIAFGRS